MEAPAAAESAAAQEARRAALEAELRLGGSAPELDPEAAAGAEPGGADPSQPRFLQPGEAGECVVMASYPRSGNSMLRGLLEGLTGVVTGSDSRPDRAMARDLKLYGLVGEGNIGSHQGGGKVWVVKSHFPEKYGWKEFAAQRAVLLVRNPVNAIRSYFNMLLTGTHTHSIAPSEYTRPGLAEVWDRHVREEIGWWCEFHRYWLRQPIPVLVVRYEDLVEARPLQREQALRRIADFLYGPTHTRKRGYAGAAPAAAGEGAAAGAAPAGRVEEEPEAAVEARLQAVLHDRDAGVVYKPRAAAVGTDFSHYTAAHQEFMLATAAPMLLDLGYSELLEELRGGVGGDAGDAGGAGGGAELADGSRTPVSDGGEGEGEGGAPSTKGDGEAPVVWCNRGLPMRPRTEEDPGARGFMWKWEHRKTVRVVQKGGEAAAPAADAAVEGQQAEGEGQRVVSQQEIRRFEDEVVGAAPD